jgi:hypothetical protein
MPDYRTASRTKDHFQDELLAEHPQIVSIAPRLLRHDRGFPTGSAGIVIGVQELLAKQIGRGGEPTGPAPIPASLPAIDEQGNRSPSEVVPIIIEPEGPVVIELNNARMRPCPGGFSCSHRIVPAGTLGGVASVDNVWGFILSNNHVIAATNAGLVGDATYQPCRADSGGAGDEIGNLYRWVPISFVDDNEVDAALSEALAPWDSYVTRDVESIGTPQNVADAVLNQSVRKSGRTTQLTTGIVLSDNATVLVQLGSNTARFVNQLQYSRMTAGGDSGSLIWGHDNLTVVGLHFAGSRDGASSYGNKILRVLELLGQERTVTDGRGNRVHFPPVQLALTE